MSAERGFLPFWRWCRAQVRIEGGEKKRGWWEEFAVLLQSLKGRSIWREVEGSQPKGRLGENSVRAKTIASFLFRYPAAGVGKLGWKFEN